MVVPLGRHHEIWDFPPPDLVENPEEQERRRLEAINADFLSDDEFQNRLDQMNGDGLTDEDYNKYLDEDIRGHVIPDHGVYEPHLNGDVLTDAEYVEFLNESKAKFKIIDAKNTDILVNLQTVVDGKNRKDIKAAILSHGQNEQPKLDDHYLDDQEDDLFHAHRFTSFRRESNFDTQEMIGRSRNSFETVKKLISRLATLLFGFGTSQFAYEEMEDVLHADMKKWDDELGGLYQEYYRRNIEEAFDIAQSLISERKDYAKTLFYQRITLYATALFAAVGIIAGKKQITYVSLGASALTLLWIFTKYGSSSFIEAKLASELQSSVGFLEEIGSTNIIANPLGMQ